MAEAAQKTQPQKSKFDTYTWEGVDKKGRRLKGETEAISVAYVNAILRRQGINPTKVRKQTKPLFTRKKKITMKDVTVFTRQFATMIQAGIPIVQAFDIVGKGHENPSMQELLLTIKQDIESGTNLQLALSKHPLYFDALYCNLVAAGEQAGILDTIMDKIATYKEKIEAIKGKIKSALFYPAAVIVVAFVVTAILLIFVIPQFESMFKGFGAELPALTQVVINLSNFMQDYWFAIFGGIIGAVFFIGFLQALGEDAAHRRPAAAARADHRRHRQEGDHRPLRRTLATMFAAGVPLVESLDSGRRRHRQPRLLRGVMMVKTDVSTGMQLNFAMDRTGLFPNMVIQMVAIGEESGELDTCWARSPISTRRRSTTPSRR
jgi:type IV pilus assembly protein PilC